MLEKPVCGHCQRLGVTCEVSQSVLRIVADTSMTPTNSFGIPLFNPRPAAPPPRTQTQTRCPLKRAPVSRHRIWLSRRRQANPLSTHIAHTILGSRPVTGVQRQARAQGIPSTICLAMRKRALNRGQARR